MLFSDKIRQLREEKQLLQRQVSAFLEMDNALYCKIERGERRAKKEHVLILAAFFQTDADDLLTLWLADQVYSIIKDQSQANKALDVVQDNFAEYCIKNNK